MKVRVLFLLVSIVFLGLNSCKKEVEQDTMCEAEEEIAFIDQRGEVNGEYTGIRIIQHLDSNEWLVQDTNDVTIILTSHQTHDSLVVASIYYDTVSGILGNFLYRDDHFVNPPSYEEVPILNLVAADSLHYYYQPSDLVPVWTQCHVSK